MKTLGNRALRAAFLAAVPLALLLIVVFIEAPEAEAQCSGSSIQGGSIRISERTADSLRVAWNTKCGSSTHINLDWKRRDQGSYNMGEVTTWVSAKGHTISGLAANTAYDVRAFNCHNANLCSPTPLERHPDDQSSTLNDEATLANKPAGLDASGLGQLFRFRWDRPGGPVNITRYELRWKPAGRRRLPGPSDKQPDRRHQLFQDIRPEHLEPNGPEEPNRRGRQQPDFNPALDIPGSGIQPPGRLERLVRRDYHRRLSQQPQKCRGGARRAAPGRASRLPVNEPQLRRGQRGMPVLGGAFQQGRQAAGGLPHPVAQVGGGPALRRRVVAGPAAGTARDGQGRPDEAHPLRAARLPHPGLQRGPGRLLGVAQRGRQAQHPRHGPHPVSGGPQPDYLHLGPTSRRQAGRESPSPGTTSSGA